MTSISKPLPIASPFIFLLGSTNAVISVKSVDASAFCRISREVLTSYMSTASRCWRAATNRTLLTRSSGVSLGTPAAAEREVGNQRIDRNKLAEAIAEPIREVRPVQRLGFGDSGYCPVATHTHEADSRRKSQDGLDRRSLTNGGVDVERRIVALWCAGRHVRVLLEIGLTGSGLNVIRATGDQQRGES